jgi:hypothetical protein
MKLRLLAVSLALGLSFAGLAEAKKSKPVNHRVTSSKVKPRKIKVRKGPKHPKVKHSPAR